MLDHVVVLSFTFGLVIHPKYGYSMKLRIQSYDVVRMLIGVFIMCFFLAMSA